MNFKTIKDKYKQISNSIRNDHISESSAQCAYYTILSFIPFIILLITLIQYTGIKPQALFDAITIIVPKGMNNFVLGIVQEVYSKSIGTISISIIFTILAAGRGVFALTKSLQTIFKIDDEDSVSYVYMRTKAFLETIIFIFLVVIGLIAMIFGNSLIDLIEKNFEIKSTFFEKIINGLIILISTFLIYISLYKFIPKHRVTFKSQLYGALIGSLLLNIVSFVFSNYLKIFRGFSITYGSLTTLMLVMMWVYTCFYTIMLGAEVNKILNRFGKSGYKKR